MVVKALVKVSAKEKYTNEEFVKGWLNEIAPRIKKMPHIQRYVINIIKSTSENIDYQGTAEMWFNTLQEMYDDIASPEGKEAEIYVKKYFEKFTTTITEEYQIL